MKASPVSIHSYLIFSLMLLLPIVLSVIPGKTIFSSSFFWMLMIIFIVFLLPQIHNRNSAFISECVISYAFLGAVIYLAFEFIIAVFMKSLALSPYDLTFNGIVINLYTQLPKIAAREIIRAYALKSVRLRYKNTTFPISLIFLVMVISDINYNRLSAIISLRDLFIYIFKDVAPAMSKHILLTVLSLNGGAKAAICYTFIIFIFRHCFPFLPSLVWIAESAIGISVPVFTAVFIHTRIQVFTNEIIYSTGSGFSSDIITMSFCVMLVWFSVGVFPVYPSIVLTGSMEPLIYPGDAVLIKKVFSEKEIYDLHEGNIINFKHNDITVTHRIISVVYDNAGNISFETKGDNNNTPDIDYVSPNNINGRIIKIIPRIGLPILFMKSENDIPEGVLDE